MSRVVYEENLPCPRCGLVMAVEYTSDITDGPRRVRLQCPYCNGDGEITLRRPPATTAVRPHGTPSVLSRD